MCCHLLAIAGALSCWFLAVEIQHVEFQLSPGLPLLWRVQIRVSGVRFHVAERHQPVVRRHPPLAARALLPLGRAPCW